MFCCKTIDKKASTRSRASSNLNTYPPTALFCPPSSSSAGPHHKSDSLKHIQHLDNEINLRNTKSTDSDPKKYLMRPKIGMDQRMKTND